MANAGKLTALAINKAKTSGYYSDGAGLYLQVSQTGTRSWIFRYRLAGHLSRNGKPLSREMGLGSIETFTLAEARDRARLQRQLVADGFDPIVERDARITAGKAATARAVTFRQAAEAFIKNLEQTPGNAKHKAQWPATLKLYAYPVIGDVLVSAIDVDMIQRIAEPIWFSKTETAKRVLQRVEKILDAATAKKQRSGDNPARWRGHLSTILTAPSKIRKKKRMPSLPYADLPAFMAELRRRPGQAARALELTILTAARTDETLSAQCCEINLATRIWTRPEDHMKLRIEHRVPLSAAAIAVIEERVKSASPDAYLFPGRKADTCLSENSMLLLIDRMGEDRKRPYVDKDGKKITVHGFRSTFSTWRGEETNIAKEIAESALAHAIPDEVEAAYQRGEFLEKRRQLMDAWATFCGCDWVIDNVLPMPARAAI